MSKLISVYERQRYATFANANDYLEKTGCHAPWNPFAPQRNWVAQPGDKGPFLLLPDIGGKSGPVEAVVLNALPTELLVPNIPAVPAALPWVQPAHAVTQSGQPVAQSVFFPTIEEIEPMLADINRLARILSRPTVNDIVDGNFEGTNAAYDYHLDPNLPEAKQRRAYRFTDSNGHIYDAGLMLQKRFSKGVAILEAGVVSGKVQDIQKPIGSWQYTDGGGWQFITDRRLGLPQPVASTLPQIGICVQLQIGEELYASALGSLGAMLFVKTGTGPIETGNESNTGGADVVAALKALQESVDNNTRLLESILAKQ